MKATHFKLLLPALLLAAFAPTAQAQMFPVECGEVSDDTKAVNYSLYWESFKNEAYVDAMPHLRWIISCAPLFPSNNDKNYRRLMEAYEKFAEQATDSTTKTAYLDSVLITYDAMIPAIKQAGVEVNPAYVNIEKGRFLQKYAQDLPERQAEVTTLYREAYEMQPDSVDAYTVQYLFADLLQRGEKAGALDFAKEIKTRFSDNAELTTYVDNYMGALFSNDEEKYAFYKERLAANPDDEEALNEVIDLAFKMRDTATLEQLEPQILAKLEADPSINNYRRLAKIRSDSGNMDGAIDLYEKAISISTDPTEKRDLWYNIGIMRHRADQISAARAAYQKALDIDQNYGAAIIGIGDTIMASACGDELSRGSVYWLATDYYQRAAQRDPSVSGDANSRIAGARRGYPSTEALFLKGIKRGASYPVACGFGGTTTVR